MDNCLLSTLLASFLKITPTHKPNYNFSYLISNVTVPDPYGGGTVTENYIHRGTDQREKNISAILTCK